MVYCDFNGGIIMGRRKLHDDDIYKFSLTIEDEIKNKLDYISQNSSYRLGPLINHILRTFCLMNSKMKDTFIQFCMDQTKLIDEQMKSAGLYEKSDLEIEKAHYQDIANLINDGNTVPIDSLNMKEIKIKDGVLIIPKDWLVVNPNDAHKHRYAAVLECRNSAKYDIPHFVMFCDYKYGRDYPDDFCDEFIRLCLDTWSDFKEKVMDKQVTPIKNTNGKGYINADKYLLAPTIGIFHIWENNDNYFKINKEAPYGAMIVRT